jgi:sulfate permease, SulP family
VPIAVSLAGYQGPWLAGDLFGGLALWAVLVPEALAYATIAGVSPVVGLYAAPPALVLYALLGSSKHLVTAPMAATAALSAAIVADLATGGPDDVAAFTAALAIVTGALALLAGLLRLGFLSSFISEPVLNGFVIGLALTIMVGQLPKVLGVPKGTGNFFEQARALIGEMPDASATTLAVGLSSFAIVVVIRRFAPAVPGALVAVALGILASHAFDLASHGVAIVGPIPSGFPTIGLPQGLGVTDYTAVAASALGVMLVGFAEGLGAAKAYAARDHSEIDPNRELVALGAANLGAGLCQGMVVNGSLSKTAVNASSGARTQVSGVAAAGMTILTLAFLTGLFEDLPEATLGAIVIAVLIELVNFRVLVQLYRLSTRRLGEIYGVAARPDFIAAMAAMLGVLVFDTLPGLFIGISVSLLLLLYRASRPHVAELAAVPGSPGQYTDRARHPENEATPGVAILRVEGGVFFANSDAVRRCVRAHAQRPGTRAVVLDAGSIPFLDVSAVKMLSDLAPELSASGVRLLIAHDIGQVQDLLEVVGAQDLAHHVYPSVGSAVQAVR